MYIFFKPYTFLLEKKGENKNVYGFINIHHDFDGKRYSGTIHRFQFYHKVQKVEKV